MSGTNLRNVGSIKPRARPKQNNHLPFHQSAYGLIPQPLKKAKPSLIAWAWLFMDRIPTSIPGLAKSAVRYITTWPPISIE
jgi:hypothetical protein